MSHDSKFPDSAEAPDQRTDRALEALQYEERAGLGFRRRERSSIGNPYGDPERYQVDHEPTSGELWAGLLAGVGFVLAIAAVFFMPLLMGALAAVFIVLGSLADGQASKIARWGFYTMLITIPIGMMLSIFVTHRALW
jgi:hypothetical protein